MTGFNALGDETHLFLFGGSYDHVWLEGVPCTYFGSPQDSRLSRFIQYAYGPAQALNSWKPDAVICSDVTSLRMASFGRKLLRRRGLPLASWIHFPLKQLRMKEKLTEADLHLAISGTIAEDLGAFLPAHKDRISTIFNAVDVDGSALMTRPETAEFLYVGRLTWNDHKRVNDLLTAASRLKGEWRLKLVGAAPDARPEYEPQLKEYAAKLGLNDRVSWMGWQEDAWAAAGSASALVMPSDREGFPMVLLEALARGVPCISSDCKSGPSEIIQEGRNGWLFPVGDVDRLTILMQAVVDQPGALPSRESVRETAYRYACPGIARKAKDAILQAMEAMR